MQGAVPRDGRYRNLAVSQSLAATSILSAFISAGDSGDLILSSNANLVLNADSVTISSLNVITLQAPDVVVDNLVTSLRTGTVDALVGFDSTEGYLVDSSALFSSGADTPNVQVNTVGVSMAASPFVYSRNRSALQEDGVITAQIPGSTQTVEAILSIPNAFFITRGSGQVIGLSSGNADPCTYVGTIAMFDNTHVSMDLRACNGVGPAAPTEYLLQVGWSGLLSS